MAIYSIGFYWFQNLAMTLLMNIKEVFWLANTLVTKKHLVKLKQTWIAHIGSNKMNHLLQKTF